uniref:Lysosome membrane protein 2 n=1 Tax=Steinernema glaseri TaxID=37863 RepID=A0A1I7ZNN7_9BILA
MWKSTEGRGFFAEKRSSSPVMTITSKKCVQATALVLGAVLLIVGVVALTVVPQFVERQVKAINYLGTDGNGTLNAVTEKWRAPKYDMKMEIYVYSVKNAQDVVEKGAKPILEQKGPYTFEEKTEKTWYKFTHNESRILYKNNHLSFFSPNLSCATCSLDEKVTVPSVVYQKLVDIAMQSSWYKWGIEFASSLQNETPFITVTVGELLFEGYEDPLVSKLCAVPIVSSICKSMGIPPRIGLFYGQNNTNDGTYEINTGRFEPSLIGHVYSWNNMTQLPSTVWWSPEARKINGYDGQLFPPGMRRGEVVDLFVGQIQRSIQMEYKRDARYAGVPIFRFGVPASMNDPTLPQNQGFNNPESPRFFNDSSVQSKGALPAGLMDLSGSLPGAPRIYMSQPRFLHCPAAVLHAVDGIEEPNPEEDETYVDIEPTTGVVIHARRVSQLNLGMLSGGVRQSGKMVDTITPMIWLRETISFDEETRQELLNRVVFINHVAYVGGVAFLTIGILLWVLFTLIAVVNKLMRNRAEDQELLIEEDGEAFGEI